MVEIWQTNDKIVHLKCTYSYETLLDYSIPSKEYLEWKTCGGHGANFEVIKGQRSKKGKFSKIEHILWYSYKILKYKPRSDSMFWML